MTLPPTWGRVLRWLGGLAAAYRAVRYLHRNFALTTSRANTVSKIISVATAVWNGVLQIVRAFQGWSRPANTYVPVSTYTQAPPRVPGPTPPSWDGYTESEVQARKDRARRVLAECEEDERMEEALNEYYGGSRR